MSEFAGSSPAVSILFMRNLFIIYNFMTNPLILGALIGWGIDAMDTSEGSNLSDAFDGALIGSGVIAAGAILASLLD